MKRLLLPLALISCLTLGAQELTTKSISVFKNGKSFVVKEGNVPLANNVYILDKVPRALFGTYWFNSSSAAIKQVVSKEETVNEVVERGSNGFLELLFANKGKPVTFTLQDGKVITGEVEDFSLPEELNTALRLKEKELAETYAVEYTPADPLFKTASPFFTLKMNNRWLSMDPATIKSVEFAVKPNGLVRSNIKVKKPVIKVEFAKGGTQNINVMYMQNGISWVPVYLLELASETEARLRLQAEVTNDVEDISNTEINFVVGVPNFKYAVGPATLTAYLQKVLAPVVANFSQMNTFSNAIAPQQRLNNSVERQDISSDEFTEADVDASEDLYFYKVKDVKLERGGRAHYPLFDVTVPIKHLYECNLPAVADEEENGYSFDARLANVVHTVVIQNNTKNPLTTGPVMIVQSGSQKPLAQDQIKYTGRGQNCPVELTQAPDVRVDEKQKVIATSAEITRLKSGSYKLLTLQCTVTITNTKTNDIDLLLRKNITGKVKTASIKYDRITRINASNLNAAEALIFNLHLKAGEKFSYVYTYEMYKPLSD